MRENARRLLFVCILSAAFAAGGAAAAYGASYSGGIFSILGNTVLVPESSDITITDYADLAMFAHGAGSAISADDKLKIDVYSEYGNAVQANEYGTVRIGSSADITTYAFQGRGLNALSGGTIHIGDGASIETRGTYADAVDAYFGGNVYLGSGTTIATYGFNAHGLVAISWSDTSRIKAGDDMTITTYCADALEGNPYDPSNAFDYANGIWAELAGEVEIGDRLSVTTYGARSRGIGVYDNGASVKIGNDGTIATYGHHAIGLWVYGVNGEASFTAGDGLTINTYYNQADGGNPFIPSNPNDYAYGIYVEEGGSAHIGNRLTVSTLGSNSHAVTAYSSYEDALVKMGKSADIATAGNNSFGLLAQYEGAVISADNGLKVTTSGEDSYGLYALSYGLLDIGGGARVSTLGDHAAAAVAGAGGTLNLGRGAALYATGSEAGGLYAFAAGYVCASDDLSITTTGYSSYGIFAETVSIVEIGKNADISTANTSSAGVVSATGGWILFDEGLRIDTAGDLAYGIFARESGYIEIDSGSQITTAGADAHAVYALDGGDIIIDGGTIIARDASANAILCEGTSDANNYSLIHGTGLFSIYGDIVAEANNTGEAKVALTLEDGSVFTGAAAILGTNSGGAELRLELSGRSTRWNVTGDSLLTELMHDGAIVDFAASAFGTTVTVDTLGGVGGLFNIKADMGGGIGDMLIVTGMSSGAHSITVTGGDKSASDGTETLTVIETADGGAGFALNDGYAEIGAWRYCLREVSGAAGSWELYGINQISNAASAAINTFAAGYLMGYAEMNTLVQRLGELRDTSYKSGFWGRIHGGKFSTDGMKQAGEFDLKYGGIHVGYDRKIETALPGDFYAGVMFGYSKGEIDFAYAGGDGDVDSKTIGVYGTYKRADGLYVDALLKYQWIGHGFHTFNSTGAKVTTGDVDTGGFGFSVEAGKRFELDNGWYVEPQAQLSYLKQDGGTFDMRNGPSFYSDGWTSLRGRLGARIGYDSGTHGFYAKVSWVREFDGDFDFKANGVPLTDSFGDNWWVYGVGYTAKLNKRNSVYFDLERSSGGVFGQDWAIKAGWRVII